VALVRADLPVQQDLRDQGLAAVRSAARLGLPALVMDDAQMAEILRHVPDTWGMGQAEIDSLPPNVRNFKCQGALESGEPYCNEAKFNNDACPARPWKVKWHPGWKWDAVHGYGMALFLMEALEEAVADLVGLLDENSAGSANPLSIGQLKERLEAEEAADYRRVVEEPSLPQYSALYHGNESFAPYLRSLYYRRQNYCHTAALPAESRYRGVLTDQLDDPPSRSSFDEVGPDCAASPAEAERLPFDAGDAAVRLVCDSRHRNVCDVPISVDKLDYFYVGYRESGGVTNSSLTTDESDGGGVWKQVTLPTESERTFYGTPVFEAAGNGPHVDRDTNRKEKIELDGVIAFCSSDCGGQTCKPDDVHFAGISTLDHGKLGTVVEMRVNGEMVSGLATLTTSGTLFSQCHVLVRGAGGGGNGSDSSSSSSSSSEGNEQSVRWDADPSGRYKIEVRVVREGHFIRFGSFLLW
jgi:hypothetical protein